HLASVEAEHLLVEVAEQVERLNGDVRTAERPLKQRPEVLDAVRVDFATHVLASVMLNGLVNVLAAEEAVRTEAIGVEVRASLDVLADHAFDGAALVVVDADGSDDGVTVRALALDEAHDASLAHHAVGLVGAERLLLAGL